MAHRPAIEASGLEKSYGAVKVLGGVDLSVPPGSVFALLGPNGAGKTTTVRILATLTPPDAGRARVAGFDVVAERRRVRRAISLTGQYAAVDETQTGEENLRMMGRLTRLGRAEARARAHELLERFDLTGAARRTVGTYSGGMRRRLDLAAGLVGHPEVIFLDEPTTGLDPRSRQAMWEVVKGLVTDGVTVFLTTQYLEEADQLADRVAVVDGGRVVAEGTPAELKERVAGQRLDLVLGDIAGYQSVARHLGVRLVRSDADRLTLGVATDGSAAQVRALLDEIDPERRAVDRFTVHSATLDDVFMALTGHGAGSGSRNGGGEGGTATGGATGEKTGEKETAGV
ncbi:daunorubicin resistance protein DrrA family ABC transporter ATP-binding protein [Streptomyces antioxidans]|uniref:ABC-type xenobiotic transporter n=1 Tax=Streptomyces antioxidans TaxID=1507734 RepID=A0A1V4D782_9ACTN|nr:daunorubicin resistance protein DrrA family ABC transporter ATP-binding protein [Streptomyces antioxidans]OPF80396.1 daunorubicin resistance protein DrrA family ABC transporter ATP-binding protein [Streptomyces antioxidans]